MLWRKQEASNISYPENMEEAAVLKAFETMQQAMIDKDMDTLDAVIKDDTIFTHMSGKQQTSGETKEHIALFNAQGEVLEIGRVALRIVSFVFPFSGLTLILGAFFQALGNSRKTLLTSVVQLVIMLASAIILSKIGTVNTVWFAFVITEVLVAGLAIILMRAVYSRTIQNIPESPKISNQFAESVT